MFQIGDVVKYSGSVSNMHGVYTVVTEPATPTARGYVLQDADGRIVRNVSYRSLSFA